MANEPLQLATTLLASLQLLGTDALDHFKLVIALQALVLVCGHSQISLSDSCQKSPEENCEDNLDKMDHLVLD